MWHALFMVRNVTDEDDMGRASDPYKQAHMKTNVAVAKTVVAPAAVVATLLLMLPLFAGGGAALAATAATATGLGSNCTRRCGNISVPYPFGIELGCYHDTGFNLSCKQQHSHRQPPKLFLGDGTVQVLHISVENSTVRINSPGVQSEDGSVSGNRTWGGGLPQSGPYFLSESTSCSRR